MITKMTDQKLNPKFVLLSGILAAGLFGAIFVGDQMVAQSAAAQNNNNSNDTVSSRSTVTTSGTATTMVDPDKFTVTVGVESDISHV